MTAPSATAAREASARANAVSRFWHSSVGKKAVMAVTGLAMIAFLIAHVLGNLQVFAGPLKINEYSATLRGLGPLLWIARAGLAVALVGITLGHLLHVPELDGAIEWLDSKPLGPAGLRGHVVDGEVPDLACVSLEILIGWAASEALGGLL